MANEYLIPFGIDLGPLLKDIRDIRKETSGLYEALKASGEASQKAFTDASESQNLLLKSTVEANKAAKQQAIEMKNLEAFMSAYGDELKEVQISQESMNKELSKGIDAAKKQLAGLKEGSKEFNKLAKEIKAAEIGLSSMNGKAVDGEKKFEKMRTTLEKNKAILQQLAAQGLQNTKVFKELEKETGNLDKAVREVNKNVKLAGSETKGIEKLIGTTQAVAGAFAVAEGTAALFGEESENIQKSILKLNAVMSILSGLQAVMTQITQEGTLANKAAAFAQGLYTTVVGTSTGALKLFRIALASTGIGLLVIGLASLVANFDKVKAKVLDLVPGLETFGNIVTNIIQKVTDWAGITSQAERDLDKLRETNEKFNQVADALVKIYEAQGGKEREIYLQRREQTANQLRELNKLEDLNKKLTKEEAARQLELSADLLAIDASEKKRLADNAKKAADEQDKLDKQLSDKRTKAQEKLDQIEKDRKDRLLSLDKQFRDLKIAAIEAEGTRLREVEQANYDDQISSVNKQVADFKGTEKQKQSLIEAANLVKEQLTLKHYATLASIEKGFNDARIAVLKNANDLADDILQDDLENQKKAIKAKYAETIKELKKLTANVADEQAKNTLAKVLEAQQAEIAQAEEKFYSDQEKRRREALDKEVKEYKELGERLEALAVKKLKALGLPEDQGQAVVQSFKNVFAQVVELYTQSIDQQIEAKQRQVDALTTQIDEVNEQLAREQELQRQGYANNVAAKVEEVARLRAERDRQLEDERRLQKERAKIASLEIAQSTITQTVTLGEAAAKIFKATSGIPVVGVALALAAVGTMFAGFLAIKNKIKSAQDQVPSFRKGDVFDILKGKASHESGGVSLVDNNGDRLAEFEGDEKLFVVNKGSSSKHEDLLRAINNDDFSKLNAGHGSLRKLLKEVKGVHFIEDAPYQILDKQRKAQSLSITSPASFSDLSLGTLQRLLEEVKGFRSQEKEKPIVLDLPDAVEVREGSFTKRYRKNKGE